MMIGNSLKSDIVPAIAAGSWGVFIPHALTWALEHSEAPTTSPRFRELKNLSQLYSLIMEIEG
jgi:putative hydrolase of the HAD superfamily